MAKDKAGRTRQEDYAKVLRMAGSLFRHLKNATEITPDLLKKHKIFMSSATMLLKLEPLFLEHELETPIILQDDKEIIERFLERHRDKSS